MSDPLSDSDDVLLKPREVAAMLGVRPGTVALWARIGALKPSVWTPGGHRRYRRADVRAFHDAGGLTAVTPERVRMEEDAVRLYRQGWSIRQVAARFDCSYGQMRRAMDFFLGEVTRDHRDIDWFAWTGEVAVLGAELGRRGFRPVPGLPPDQQLDVVKHGEDLAFNLLRRDESGRVVVGGGPWAGSPWPEDMLETHVGRIKELPCPIINPRAQIEIKQMMPVWVPGTLRRAKDVTDIARLQAALRRPGTA